MARDILANLWSADGLLVHLHRMRRRHSARKAVASVAAPARSEASLVLMVREMEALRSVSASGIRSADKGISSTAASDGVKGP